MTTTTTTSTVVEPRRTDISHGSIARHDIGAHADANANPNPNAPYRKAATGGSFPGGHVRARSAV